MLDLVPIICQDGPNPSQDALPALRPAPTSVDLLGLLLAGLKPQSVEGYRKDLRDFARFVGRPIEPALQSLFGLAAGQANAVGLAYRQHLEQRHLAPATICRRLAALARAVDGARRVGLTDLALEVDRPEAEAFRDTAGPGVNGWERILGFYDGAPDNRIVARNLAILLTLHDRALRRGELVGLDYPSDVDLTRPAIQILGKGRRTKEWLTINPRTRAALEGWIRHRGTEPGPLFTRVDRAAKGFGRLTGESVNRMVKTLAYQVGLPRVCRAHGLRHQAITEALDSGWDVRDVRKFSRHRTVDTVLIYDDSLKDVGGQITRGLGARRRRRPSAGK